MILKNIELINFRNYKNLKLPLKSRINILYGNNGAGKSNLLESIYVLGFSKSYRSFQDGNLIKYGENNTKIKGTILNGLSYDLEVFLSKTSKTLKIDGINVDKIGNYIEQTNIIIFTSEDLELIRGYPKSRRTYLDMEISQISKNYYIAINAYNKLLKIRNDYLKRINNGEKINQNYFDTLNDYIVEKSIFIYQMRHQYIKKINKICKSIYRNISGIDNFEIKYIPSINYKMPLHEEIRKMMHKQMKENLEKEIFLKTTICGPHKDDFEFSLNGKNLKLFGSQGQQRAAILALKLSEVELIKDYKKNSPILLLDDVFSELDGQKINNLLAYINKEMQVIITTTELNSINKELMNNANLIHVTNGKIENEVQ